MIEKLMNNNTFFKESIMPQKKIFYMSFFSIFLISTLLNIGIHIPQVSLNSSLQSPHSNWVKALASNNSFHLLSTGQMKQEKDKPYNNANAYIAVDLTSGKILEGKNIASPFAVASLTKVMTAVVTLDLTTPQDIFAVSPKAANIEPTKIGVVAGQKMLRDELLYAALLTSANDAAQVLAEGIDEKFGQGAFVQAMNIKAKSLGMMSTHFSNPQGFDSSGNYSSVSDLAILAQYALSQYPLFRQIVKTDYYFLPEDNNHKQFDLYNWNGLLGVYPNIMGLKIGNTSRAGYTTMVASERENKKVLVIVLGSPGVLERDLWAASLLDEAFWNLGQLAPIAVDEISLKEKYSKWKYWN